jgi:hypothetical protein
MATFEFQGILEIVDEKINVIEYLFYFINIGDHQSISYSYILNSCRPESALEFDNLRKIIIKYYLEEYFGIDVQMKVINFEYWILFVWLDFPTISPMCSISI